MHTPLLFTDKIIFFF